MKIIDAIFTPGNAAFYFDDQQAIKAGATQNGFIYTGNAVTEGFNNIRQPGESISITLILENGQMAKGDCVAVQYSGAGGRDPLFTHKKFLPFLKKNIADLLKGRDASFFLKNSRFFDHLVINGKSLHTAIRYGISQALLDAAAIAKKCSKTEVICQEYQLPVIAKPISLFGQSGDDRYTAVDKMLLKKVDALPHGLINNIPEKLGEKGEILCEYVRWLRERIFTVRDSVVYYPDIHIDVYGTLGIIFDNDYKKIAEYIHHLQTLAHPFNLYIEGPVDGGSRDQQISALKEIKSQLKTLKSPAKIVADEWCNTYKDIVLFADAHCCDMIQIKTPDLGCIHNIIEATLYCKKEGIETYQGGTCNETDISAQSCVHIALATRPDRMLAKPGMGFDEGMTIVNNEMLRTVGLLEHQLRAKRKIVNVDTLAQLP
ncbi:MAG: methylaspartate ammonia-lyase [Cellvibrionaceae bacterium]